VTVERLSTLRRPAGRGRLVPPPDDVLAPILGSVEVFHDADGVPFADVIVSMPALHHEIMRVLSRAFRTWLAGAYYRSTGRPLPARALADGLAVLSAIAVFDGPEREVGLRISAYNGAISGLRRAQARALDTPAGDDIARRLIAEKVAAQAETLAAVDRVVGVSDEVVAAMQAAAAGVHLATGRDEIRLAEAQAAGAYWSAWAPVPVRFARRDVENVPRHWQTVGSRASALTGNPRLATTAAQAVINYMYALLESEATLAARIVGLDPGLGVLHADQLNRDSLSADLMEPVRPLVDRFVLRLLDSRTFALTDFYETRQGVCRVTPPLARELAETLPEWRQAVGRVAEDVARLLDHSRSPGRALPTPISGSNRSAGRGFQSKRRPNGNAIPVAGGCIWCGGQAAAGRRTCSAECRTAVDADNLPAFVAAGPANLARWRDQGGRAELTDEGRARIRGRAVNAVTEARDWQRIHPWPKDSGEFEREILPALAGVPARSLAEATGLSVGYCRQVKKGAVTPHPMWWEALRTVRPPSDAGRIP
jgi:CRISPR-associated endonuclease Cas1